jgi:hypothetical protein
MNAKTTTNRPAATARSLRDPQLERALLLAMKGALKRSIVLLPLTEEDDRVQEYLGNVLFGA